MFPLDPHFLLYQQGACIKTLHCILTIVAPGSQKTSYQSSRSTVQPACLKGSYFITNGTFNMLSMAYWLEGLSQKTFESSPILCKLLSSTITPGSSKINQ